MHYYIRETNHEDQTDVSFVIPGVRRSPVSPDFNTILATNMTLCRAFLRRHLWKGIHTSYTPLIVIVILP